MLCFVEVQSRNKPLDLLGAFELFRLIILERAPLRRFDLHTIRVFKDFAKYLRLLRWLCANRFTAKRD